MKIRRKRSVAKGGLEIMEEAFHLVREAPLRVHATYCFGTLPFVLGLLYFWADMSKSAFAYTHLAKGAFVVALLFIWMKSWQVVYARQLWAEVSDEEPPRWTPGRICRVVVRQTIVQPSGLFLLPLALFMVVPFGWAYALYQNMTVLEDASGTDIVEFFKKSERLARPDQRQNFLIIWTLSPYLMVTAAAFFLVLTPVVTVLTPGWGRPFLIFYGVILMLILIPLSPIGMIVGANIALAMLELPGLLHMLTGIKTPFILSVWSMLNTTFVAAVCGLVYLCLDPLLKAAYLLRCFYARSIHTGEDLRAGLKHMARKARVGVIILCVLAVNTAVAEEARAQEDRRASFDSRPLSISPSELDHALDRELQSRQYSWRMPRIPPSEARESVPAAFMRGIAETLADWGEWISRRLQPIMQRLEEISEWLRKRMPTFEGGTPRKLTEVSDTLRLVIYLLSAALICVIGVFLWRSWKTRKDKSLAVHAEEVKAKPDIEKETTTAGELPEDGWLTLARELLERGELRLALRAVFLASLAYLAQCNFIQIALFKSNRDYRRELERRAHAQPGMLDIFSQNATIYESVWYGTHEARHELIDQLFANQEKFRTYGIDE